jgi:hypothetical protein
MKTASVAQVKANFDDYLKASVEEPVLLVRDGKPIAVLSGGLVQDELEDWALASDPRFRKLVAAFRRRFRKGKGIPHAELWASIEQKHPEAFQRKSANRKRRSSKTTNQ